MEPILGNNGLRIYAMDDAIWKGCRHSWIHLVRLKFHPLSPLSELLPSVCYGFMLRYVLG